MLFKNLTTLEIGGPIKLYKVANNYQELINILQFVKEKEFTYLPIGAGSNLLVSDEGFDGVVIKNKIDGITKLDEAILKVNSGTILQALVDTAQKEGLGGLEKLTGIPGTVGGAVFGNAGAYGQTISDHILKVEVLDPQSLSTIKISKQDCQFDYRKSIFKRTGQIILCVYFQLTPTSPKILKTTSTEVLGKRLIKYPPGIKCPGSFFKNLLAENIPPDVLGQIPNLQDYYGKVPAWYFLDQVGAKGAELGDIQISKSHGNFFMNIGDGTAKDFYTLAEKYYQKVKQKFGVRLSPEVQFVNLPTFERD